MGKKRETKLFHIGVGVKNDDQRTPLKGKPNTNLDTYRKKDGKLTSRRKFGPDGNAQKDLDTGHQDHNKEAHAHDFEGGKRGEKREKLSRQERREIKKAEKKRRAWNSD